MRSRQRDHRQRRLNFRRHPRMPVRRATSIRAVPPAQVRRRAFDSSARQPIVLFLAGVPYDVISKAQKLCRYANSSLEHEDVNTAIQNCEQALELLRPYRKN